MQISKDERELYDRQIRLWGLEGQGRLSNARVFVAGLSAASIEAVKNLVLAGVGMLLLQSSELVTEESLGYNFFVSAADVGENVAEASKRGAQRLNPRVAVKADSTPIANVSDDTFDNFNVLIVSQLADRAELIRLNDLARANNAAYYMALLSGWGGFLFVDLVAHEFALEKETLSLVPDVTKLPVKVSGTQEVLRAVVPEPTSGSTTIKLTLRETYISLREALQVGSQFGNKLRPRVRAKISPYLSAFLAYIDNNENPDIAAKALALGIPVPADGFVAEFNKSIGAEISGVGAVIGGFLAQEVLNYLTRRELPIQNVLVYDSLQGKGPVYYLSD